MSRRKPRGLRPEEEDIWRQVARTARPMEGRPKLTKPFTATNAPAPAKQTVVPIAPFEIGAKSETALFIIMNYMLIRKMRIDFIPFSLM